MLTYEKVTYEDAVLTSIKDNPSNIGVIMSASNETTIHLSFTTRYLVPAKYAKEILKNYMKEQLLND